MNRRWWAVAAMLGLVLAALPGLGWAEGYATSAECWAHHQVPCAKVNGMWVPTEEASPDNGTETAYEYDEENLRRQGLSMGTNVSGTLEHPLVAVDMNQVVFPDVQPYLDLDIGRVRVPVRFVSESLGAHVEWEQATQMVTITNEHSRIQLAVDNPVVLINGKEVAIDAPPTLLPPGRVMVPLRFVSEAFGAAVDWVGSESPDPMDEAWGKYQVWIWVDWGYWGKYTIHERIMVQSHWFYRGPRR